VARPAVAACSPVAALDGFTIAAKRPPWTITTS
jgi:hypothetical protein